MAGELLGEDCKNSRSARRDRKKCVEAAFDDYATKPIDRRKLIDTIRAHLEGRGPATSLSHTTL